MAQRVVRLVGAAEMGSSGIMNDRLSGAAYTAAGEIPWSGEHTTHDIVLCPPGLDSALSFLGEFGLGRELATIPPLDVTNFHGETNIVSAQMRAEAPDGTAYLADYRTEHAHTGNRSMRTGIAAGANVYSYSDFRQKITVPRYAQIGRQGSNLFLFGNGKQAGNAGYPVQ